MDYPWRVDMAKKLGKLVAVAALLGAASAGAYYYYKSKEDDFDEDFDDEDFVDSDIVSEDDFEDELEDEMEDEINIDADECEDDFVPLKLTAEDARIAKEAIEEAAKKVTT